MKRLFYYLIIISLTFTFSSCKQHNSHRLNDDGLFDNEQKTQVKEEKNQEQQQKNNSQEEDAQYSQQNNFVNKEFGFSIWFPQTPVHKIDTVNLNNYSLLMHTYLYDGGNFVYMISVVDYPEELLKNTSIQDLLKNAQKGATSSLGLEIELSESRQVHGYPALYFRAKSQDMYLSGMDVVIGTKLFQIFMLDTEDYPDPVAENDFIGSFTPNIR